MSRIYKTEDLNMASLIKQARDGWEVGKKNEAFMAAMTGLELCSMGITRLMRDMEAMQKKLKELNDRNTGP